MGEVNFAWHESFKRQNKTNSDSFVVVNIWCVGWSGGVGGRGEIWRRNTKRAISVSLYFNLHICVVGVTLNEDHLFMLIYYYTDLFLMSSALSVLKGVRWRGGFKAERRRWMNIQADRLDLNNKPAQLSRHSLLLWQPYSVSGKPDIIAVSHRWRGEEKKRKWSMRLRKLMCCHGNIISVAAGMKSLRFFQHTKKLTFTFKTMRDKHPDIKCVFCPCMSFFFVVVVF